MGGFTGVRWALRGFLRILAIWRDVSNFEDVDGRTVLGSFGDVGVVDMSYSFPSL